jgi:hypothetical protein
MEAVLKRQYRGRYAYREVIAGWKWMARRKVIGVFKWGFWIDYAIHSHSH